MSEPMQVIHAIFQIDIPHQGVAFFPERHRNDTQGIIYKDYGIGQYDLLEILSSDGREIEGLNGDDATIFGTDVIGFKTRILDAVVKELGFETVKKDLTFANERADENDYWNIIRRKIRIEENWYKITGRKMSGAILRMFNDKRPMHIAMNPASRWLYSELPNEVGCILTHYKQIYCDRIGKCRTKQDMLTMFRDGKFYNTMIRAYMEYEIRERLNDERSRGRQA